jgi:hypothetical protein
MLLLFYIYLDQNSVLLPLTNVLLLNSDTGFVLSILQLELSNIPVQQPWPMWRNPQFDAGLQSLEQ